MLTYLICTVVTVGLSMLLLTLRDGLRNSEVIQGREIPAISALIDDAEDTEEIVEHEEFEQPSSPLRFVIDGLFLERSFEYVCQSSWRGFVERFHFASGVAIEQDCFLICHILPVRYAQQSAGGVKVADESTIACLANLDRVGSSLLGHFHSHPGFGSEANHPSATDRTFQAILEKGGHIAIGGIFSRDGFVRFFAGDSNRFEVEVRGKNIKKVGTNVYKLSLADGALQNHKLVRRVQPG